VALSRVATGCRIPQGPGYPHQACLLLFRGRPMLAHAVPARVLRPLPPTPCGLNLEELSQVGD
jgi:hypothetical protein